MIDPNQRPEDLCRRGKHRRGDDTRRIATDVRERIDAHDRGCYAQAILVLVVGMLIVPFIVTARAQAPAAPVFASKVLVDNDRVRIQRLSVPAGFRETLQVVPNDQIAIQVTPGDLEVVISGQKTAGG